LLDTAQKVTEIWSLHPLKFARGENYRRSIPNWSEYTKHTIPKNHIFTYPNPNPNHV